VPNRSVKSTIRDADALFEVENGITIPPDLTRDA
jgi:hypothetical protein